MGCLIGSMLLGRRRRKKELRSRSLLMTSQSRTGSRKKQICWEGNCAKSDPSKKFLACVADHFPLQKVEKETRETKSSYPCKQPLISKEIYGGAGDWDESEIQTNL